MSKTFKVILAGDGRVGKTTIRKQYLGEQMKKDYMMTIGADFAVKKVELDDVDYKLQIWDLAGQPKFKAIRDKYYQAADGVLLTFDLTSRKSFDNIPTWVHEYMKNTDNNLRPMMLIGNKLDLIEKGIKGISDEEVIDYLENLNKWGSNFLENFDASYVKTSATHDINVDKAFNDILLKMSRINSNELDIHNK